MSSSQAPVNFQMRDASHFQNTGENTMREGASIHPDTLVDLDFMMENNRHAHDNSLATPPHMDVIGNPQFADFSFGYHGMPEDGMHADSKLENTSDPYTLSGPSSASDHRNSTTSIQHDHRDSITSLTGDHRTSISSVPAMPLASFSSGLIGQGRKASVSGGSEDASPSSNRATGALDGGYGDEFGLNSGGAVDGSDLGSRTKEEKNDPNPPWSELKTKAGKERKRLPLACIACRRKKIRCSGEKPACKHCLRSRIPCVYKVTTRKAAPRTDYMAMLDKRLKRMEERIIKIVPKEEQDGTAVS